MTAPVLPPATTAPRPRRGTSLRTRFALGGAGAVALLALLVGPGIVSDARAAPYDEVDDRLLTVGRVATPALTEVSAGPRAEDVAEAAAVEAAGDREVPAVSVVLVLPDGPPVTSGPLPAELPDSAVAGFVTTGGTDDWRVLTVTVDARSRPDEASAVAVQYAVPLGAARRAASQATVGIVGGLALLVLVAAALSWAVGAVAARPLRLLRDTTARLRDGGRVPTDHRVAEADDLARTVNALLDRADEERRRSAEALEAARTFTSAASHELRTPLTGISTNLDVLLGYPDLDAAERTAVLREVRADLDRLLSLLTGLHELARGDLQHEAARQPVDLAEVADRVVQAAARAHPGARVELVAVDDVVVSGWPDGLGVLVDNLVGNALRHGRPPVLVEVARAGDVARLVVTDAGPGIPPAARAVVFQRFARGRTSAPGSGLGLALVAQQVRWHGGTVVVDDAPAGGARFTVELPLAPTPAAAPTAP